MKQDQFERLVKLSEQLTDVVLVEADPAGWAGDGTKLSDLSRDQRGDRYWCKKNAAATLSILTRVHVLTNMVLRAAEGAKPPAEPSDDDDRDDLEKMISKAEREAEAILERAGRGRAN